MEKYLTTEEVAELFRVDPAVVLSLVENQRLRAIRVGDTIRFREIDLDKFAESSAIGATDSRNGHAREDATGAHNPGMTLEVGSRWCWSVGGRKQFRVRGSVAKGAEIWPGQARYPIKLPKVFMADLLAHFRNQEVRIGGKFDDPGRGSLGDFIQKKLQTKMNPAVYVAGLLVDEGYAERERRGYLRFRSPR